MIHNLIILHSYTEKLINATDMQTVLISVRYREI